MNRSRRTHRSKPARAAAPYANPQASRIPIPPGAPLPWPHRIALGLGFVLLALLSTRRLGSLDIGFHLKAGEFILSGQGWPRHDTFTFTVNDHPYVDTSWGYQVLVALTHRAFAAPGLVLLHGLLIVLLFFVLYRTARLAPIDPASLLVFLVAAGVACEMRFDVRPEVVSYALLAIVLHLLHRHAEGRRSPLFLLPVIHLAWANLHSLFILGWIAMGACLAGLYLRDRRADRRLLLWCAAAVAVAILNPYGWRGVTFPFTLATRLQADNAFAGSIGEFASPFTLRLSEVRPFYPRVPINLFRALAVLALAAVPAVGRQRRFHLIAMVIPFGVLAVLMVRNMPLLMIAAVPILIWGLPAEAVLERLRLRGRVRAALLRAAPVAVGLLAVILGLRVVHDAYYVDSRRIERFGLGWNRLALPVDAARFADRVGLRGPLLNYLNFGGYLMWARPDPVFIDGRLEVMGERFYDDYRRALASEDALEATVAQYGIRSIVFPYSLDPPLLARLSRDARWRLAYADSLAVLFVRDGPEADARVDRELVDRLRAPAPPVDLAGLPGLGAVPRDGRVTLFLQGLARRREFPTEDYSLGLFHAYRQEAGPAEARFAAAIAKSGGAFYEAYNNLGAMLLREGRQAEARACYRIVLQEDPDNRVARQVTSTESPDRPAPR